MNKANEKQNRNKYSPEFKDQVLDRAEKDGVPQVAKDLGIKESLIYYWRSRKRLGGTTLENQKVQQMELARLRREKERLEMEVAFLKKAALGSSSHCNNLLKSISRGFVIQSFSWSFI